RTPRRRRRRPQDAPPRPLDEQAVQSRLHLRQLHRDMLTHVAAVAQLLRADATHGPLRLLDQRVELRVAADVQRAEPLEEAGEIAHGRVAEDLGLAILTR